MPEERICIVGLGEVGGALFRVMEKSYPNIAAYDLLHSVRYEEDGKYDVLHVCIPWSDTFLNSVRAFVSIHNPSLVVVHSTVPVGTTAKIPNSVHSPVLGDHTNMEVRFFNFKKWIGGPKELSDRAERMFYRCGMMCRQVPNSEQTELLKLLCLAHYGVDIAFNRYATEILETIGAPKEILAEWDRNYNEGVTLQNRGHLSRPILTPMKGSIGGHCVIPGTQKLSDLVPNNLLEEVLKYG